MCCKCKKMLQPYVDWCRKNDNLNADEKKNVQYFIDFNIAMIDKDRFWIEYCSSMLKNAPNFNPPAFHPPYGSYTEFGNVASEIDKDGTACYYSNSDVPYCDGLILSGNSLVGQANQIFSDRIGNATYTPPQNPNPDGFSFSFPITIATYRFDPQKADRATIQINIETGQATFTLLTWGNAQGTANLRCANGIMYGFFEEPWSGGIMISLRKAKWSKKIIGPIVR